MKKNYTMFFVELSISSNDESNQLENGKKC